MTRVARRRESIAERRERRAGIDDPALVLDAAARFLEARSRSIAEVRRRLTGAGYVANLVDGAITRLLELGILDDEAFARAWVESRDRARPRGERAIRSELGLKGVDREVIDSVVGARRDRAPGLGSVGHSVSADQAAAEHLLARTMRTLSRIDDPRLRRQRAYALLARNGFDSETCRMVAAKVVDGSSKETVEEP